MTAPITPNNAFFVRYHLADVPYNIDPGQIHAGGQRQGRSAAQTVAEGHQEAQGGRNRRRQSMLRQQPRLLQPARRRRPARQRRDGQCALARRAAEGRARHGRRAAGRQAGHLQRHGRAGQRQDAGFRQGARYRSRPRRRGDAGLWHERRGSAGSQRLSAAPRGARLLRHLLGQAPQRDHRHRQCVRRLLDEDPPTGFRTRPTTASSRAPRRRRRSRSTASRCAPSSPMSPTAPS